MFQGIPISQGIAIAKAYIIKDEYPEIGENKVDDTKLQLERLEAAVGKSKEQVGRIFNTAVKKIGAEKAAIFQAHLMFFDDPGFIGQAREKIEQQHILAEYAVRQVVDTYVELFKQIDDEYMSGRAADIQDVGRRLICNLMNRKTNDISAIDGEVILIAKDLKPSETVQIDRHFVKGMITGTGGRTSHSAIIARSLGIPAIVGAGPVSTEVSEGDLVILDGRSGKIFINPEAELLKEYRSQKEKHESLQQVLKKLKGEAARTPDGHIIEMAANIGSPEDVESALDNGAEAVGLYRTEFLYMNRNDLPGEEEQFHAYKSVAVRMGRKPVTIRTLDIGGDKQAPCMKLPHEENPFLGWRAIRICLERKDMFKSQLRAVLRASHFGKLRILFPMVSSFEEVIEVKEIMKEVMQELRNKNIPFDEEIETGIMVEVPSVAVAIDLFVDEVDFFSIGTNDLCQYLLAVDRMNEKIAGLYQPLHPAMLRLINQVIEASHKKGKFTAMCGEMASDPAAALILLGLGLDEFSMEANSIPYIKNLVRSVTFQEARAIAGEALNLKSAQQVRDLVQGKLKEIKDNEL